MQSILTLLSDLGIRYVKYDHPAVYSCREAEEKCPPMPGAQTKQLLLRDKQRSLALLLIVMHDKKVDMRKLARRCDVQGFSFASPELMMELLHVTPGSVTPLGLIHDPQHRVHVLIDKDAWDIGSFLFHPLVNTATLSIDRAGLQKFFAHTGHSYEIVDIPKQEREK